MYKMISPNVELKVVFGLPPITTVCENSEISSSYESVSFITTPICRFLVILRSCGHLFCFRFCVLFPECKISHGSRHEKVDKDKEM